MLNRLPEYQNADPHGDVVYGLWSRAHVVVVEDQDTTRHILARLMETLDRTTVQAFGDPAAALEWVQHNRPDLILTDERMPGMGGIEFIQQVRTLPDYLTVPIVMVTCVEDRTLRYSALEAGATDFLTKPIDYQEARARCRNLLALSRQQRLTSNRVGWLEEEIRSATEALREREEETLMRMAKAGEYRDEETGSHVIRMARYSRLIAESMGVSHHDCKVIELAAPMHDIGKIGIPDRILRKPAKLSRDEFDLMKEHTRIGYDILKDSPSKYIQTGAVIALSHHERYDGSGYPEGLAANRIPLEARIVAVADVFDALTSHRPYKGRWSFQDAIDYLSTVRGTHLDPEAVNALIRQGRAAWEIAREHTSADA